MATTQADSGLAANNSNANAPQGGRIRSLVVPVGGAEILIPNAMVAEIVTAVEPAKNAGKPDWLLGLMPWRGVDLPLVSIGNAVDGLQADTVVDRGQVLVLHTLKDHESMGFYGILSNGIPHLLQADQTNVTSVPQGVKSPLVLAQVLIEGKQAFIPDFDLLESMLAATL